MSAYNVMTQRYINQLFVLVAVLMSILLFAGCSGEEPVDPNTIWIVTEQTSKDGMNSQAERVIKSFEKVHEGITVELEVLPKEGQEREVRLEKLRAAIMSGKGPDGFLLPSDTNGNAPLFLDINQAMRSGLFSDITNYYDADSELDKDGLEDTIMEAGVIDGARYILPLRYDFPVIYADAELLNSSGLNTGRLSSSTIDFWNETTENGDIPWILGATSDRSEVLGHFTYFSQIIDYDTNILTGTEVLNDFLTGYQHIIAMRGEGYPIFVGNIVSYLGSKQFFGESHPMEVSTFSAAYEYAAISKFTGQEVSMIPLRTMEGDVLATVTYFAAVGAGSNNPEMTYAFLREFLSETCQWEQNRDTTFRYATGLIAEGWPVRSVGAVEPLWQVCKKINKSQVDNDLLFDVTISDTDIPILNTTVNKVRFGNRYLEYQILGTKLALLNDPSTGEATNIDISKLIIEIYEELEHHLAEG